MSYDGLATAERKTITIPASEGRAVRLTRAEVVDALRDPFERGWDDPNFDWHPSSNSDYSIGCPRAPEEVEAILVKLAYSRIISRRGVNARGYYDSLRGWLWAEVSDGGLWYGYDGSVPEPSVTESHVEIALAWQAAALATAEPTH